MKKFVLLAALCALVLMPLSAAQGQEPSPDAVLHLQAATFDPIIQGEPTLAADGSVRAAGVPVVASPYYLVQFSSTVKIPRLRQIELLGGEIFGYVPDNAHIVRMTPHVAAKVNSLPDVRWVGTYKAGYKLADNLAQSYDALTTSGTLLDLTVMAFAGEELAPLENYLRQQGATIINAADSAIGPVVTVRAVGSAIAAIIQHPAVSWVEEYVQPVLANAEGRKIMGAEAVWQDFGYYGAGQIVAISDSGLSVEGAMSEDFGDRLIRAFPPSAMNIRAACRAKTTFTDLHGHGTHVAGSVLGAGVLSGSDPASKNYANSHAGLAPEAQFVFMSLNTDGSSGIQCVDANGDYIAKGYDLGARISTNSWGSNDQGEYGEKSSVVDNYIWNHKDYLVLFAAGNDGRRGNQTVGSPGTAKNVLTVGATENNRTDRGEQADDPDTVTNFSSRGPTADGRLKPDVVAPGSFILSVRAPQAPIEHFWEPFDQNYAYMGGTSMATPLTAGGAALVREWMGKVRGIPNPSAALMKAVIINGATQLPSEPARSINSGNGRVDLKNTLTAQYAIMDDHIQGMSTGETFEYTIDVVGDSAAGTIIAADLPIQTDEVRASALDSMTVTDETPVVAGAPRTDPTGFTMQPLPGHAAPREVSPIAKSASSTGAASGDDILSKAAADAPLTNPAPGIAAVRAADAATSIASFSSGHTTEHANSFLFNIVGGGDFEEPWWSLLWSSVWLGLGQPEILTDPDFVINGQQSMWLGGHEGEDSIWYPVHFPDKIDTEQQSLIEFNLRIVGDDPGDDIFCVALTDASGYFIPPYDTEGPACTDEDGDFTYTHNFTPAELQALADQTAYLVLYTESDGARPHMSALVDDIALAYDLPDVETVIAPPSGPPGTQFLVVSKYNAPYSEVTICSCSEIGDYPHSAYADAQGTVAIFLQSSPDMEAGTYEITTVDFFDRTAVATVTIGDAAEASLTVSPQSGPGGTKFTFSGRDFVPNDPEIAVTLEGESAGTVGSNAQGQVGFSLTTRTNAPPGTYTIQLKDSAGRTASAKFTVTAAAADDANMTVTPETGPQGTEFQFVASNFISGTVATVQLDGQAIGEATPNAAGEIAMTLRTTTDTAPGTYTLAVQQGNKQASAQFAVTQASGGGGGGGTEQTGSGLYLTLVWTDPPAQVFAAQTLVNNLDLIVQTPDGKTLYGNGGTSPDTKDNVETIRLEKPVAGQYKVTVKAERVSATFGSQPYALVATTKQSFETNVSNVDLNGETVQPTPVPMTQTLSSLSGFIYIDLNVNGTREPTEKGIAGARVLITSVKGGPTTQTTTDGNGAYVVQDLPIGTYKVQAVVPGLTFTTSSSVQKEVGVTGATAGNIGAVFQALLPAVRK